MKASGKVTLLGDTTDGGSCIVLPMSSAWGNVYQISGPERISFVKNGSYYQPGRFCRDRPGTGDKPPDNGNYRQEGRICS